MHPPRITVKTGENYKEERWLGVILAGYLLLSIFSGIMFGIAISKILPGAKLALGILAGLFILVLLVLNRGVSNEHRKIIGFIFAAFYMLTGILLLFHPYLWIFGIAGVARSLMYLYKHTEHVRTVLTKKAALGVLGLIVVVLVLVLAINNINHGEDPLPEINEISTAFVTELSIEPPESEEVILQEDVLEVPACTWVQTKQVTYETRYLVYYRSLVVKNGTNSTIYDVIPTHIGFNITNYLDVPIQVKVDYHKEAPWYGISEDKWMTLPIKATSTLTYLDEGYFENAGCDIDRCNLTVTQHSLASSVMRIEEVKYPIITIKDECV